MACGLCSHMCPLQGAVPPPEASSIDRSSKESRDRRVTKCIQRKKRLSSQGPESLACLEIIFQHRACVDTKLFLFLEVVNVT